MRATESRAIINSTTRRDWVSEANATDRDIEATIREFRLRILLTNASVVHVLKLLRD